MPSSFLKINDKGNTLNYIQSIPNHSATTSITRLLSCCAVNKFNPTFIKNSPEKTSPLPEKEAENGEVAVRKQGEGDKGTMKIEEFGKNIAEEVSNMINKW